MQIKYHGQSCFSIKEGDFTIMTDPTEGKTPEKTNVVLLSQPEAPFQSLSAETKIFNWPGEYETGNVYFLGIDMVSDSKDAKSKEGSTIFKVECNGLRLCHWGRIGNKPTSEQLEQIGDVDILFVPVGEKQGFSPRKAKEVIEQIEPRIMIPMLHDPETLAAFLKEMGLSHTETLDVLSVKRSELPEEMSKLVVLNKM